MSDGKKEYILKINGVSKSTADVKSLRQELDRLDASVNKVNNAESKTTASTRQKTAALSEEEKAAKKLEATQKKIAEAQTDAAKKQAAANKELRERNRELSRSVAYEQAAEGSIVRLGMELTDARKKYDELSEAERQNADVGGVLLGQIQEMDAKYKALKESTGRFQDSVGNYEKANKGIESLREGFEGAAGSSLGLAANAGLSAGALQTFGNVTDEVTKELQKMQMVTALLQQGQALYNSVVKDSIVQENFRKVVDQVRTVQLRAKAAAEAQAAKGTMAGTIAQKAFNIVASANPYVLLALAIVAVGAAMYALSKKTESATEAQNKLNAAEKYNLDLQEIFSARTNANYDDKTKALKAELDLVKARGNTVKNLKAIRDAEDEVFKSRVKQNRYNQNAYESQIKALDANKDRLQKLQIELARVESLQKAIGDDEIVVDVTINGKATQVEANKAVESLQGEIDNLNRSVTVATEILDNKGQLAAEAKVIAAQRLAEDKALAKERREIEVETQRAAEDAKLALIKNGYAKARAEAKKDTTRQIEDIKKRLAEDEKLTDAARANLNSKIISLRKKLTADLLRINREEAAAELAIARERQDAETSIILGELERQQKEIATARDREIADLKERLKTDKDLTKKSREDINATIKALEIKKNRELATINAADAAKVADQQLNAIETNYKRVIDRTGEVIKRNKTGLKLIDVDATRANLNAVDGALTEYIQGLQNFATNATDVHLANKKLLKEGTSEYTAEQQRYAAVIDDVTNKIKEAQKQQAENAKENKELTISYYIDLFSKINKIASEAANVIGTVVSTISSVIGLQLESLNARLDNASARYDEAKKKSDSYVNEIQNTEAQLQDATGGTADALREQLADQMAARNEALRQEKRIQREKEALEREIAKKERQQKKLDLISQLAQGIANTALSVSNALSQWPFPLNLVIAGLMGAAGAVQTGIITRQLTKLEDGGEINGPSHASGGIEIPGTGVEIEGGEFVTNKNSYANNRALVQAINTADGPLTAAQITAVTGAPTIQATPASNDERLINAIQAINIRPVVSVKDINDVNDTVVGVQELAGFK